MALLATLAGVLMLASMALALEGRNSATNKVLAGLERFHRDAIGADSVREVLRGALFEAQRDPVSHPELSRLNGTPFEFELDGTLWEVRVSDVDGLVDLYLAPLEVLALLPASAEEILRRRQAMLAELPPGTRLPSETQTLARLGFDAAARARLGPLVTQLSRTGGINPELAPSAIRAAAATLSAADIAAGQTAEISLQRLPMPLPQ